MSDIELWEQEIVDNAKKEQMLNEARIYNFYGEDQPVIETVESILEYTQKELLDPNFLDKLKNKQVKFSNAGTAVSVLLSLAIGAITVVSGIVVGGALGGIGTAAISIYTVILIMAKLSSAFDSLSVKIYNKNVKKYNSQFNKLKEKCKKAIEKDAKNAGQYKKILAQIEKIEKDKAEQAKRFAEQQKQENLDYTIKAYKEAVDLINGKTTFEDITDGDYSIFDGLRICNKYLKFPENKLFDMMTKGCNIKTGENLYDSEYLHKIGIKSGTKLIQLSMNPDADFLVIIDKKKILYAEAGEIEWYSLYKFAEDNGDTNYNIEDAIEEADKYLGYYKVAKCPDNVQARELSDTKPIKEDVEFLDFE